MTVRSFTVFGVSVLPYLGFNAWFLAGPGHGVFTKLLWLDVIGNAIFLTGSLVAAKLLRDDAEEAKEKTV